MSEAIVSFRVNFFVYRPKINKNPIKNSKPIMNLAIKGAKRHPPIPRSINVYSNGSIGYNLVYPLNKNTKPIKEQIIKNEIFRKRGFI